MYFYYWFAGAEHVAPHDGGPGTNHLITAGDHHHRQGSSLHQHRRRQWLSTAALCHRGLFRRSPQWCTPGQHAENLSQTWLGGALRWLRGESVEEETRVLRFAYSDSKRQRGRHHRGSRHRLVYVHFDSLTSVDPLNLALASLSDWKNNGCSW